MSKVDAVEKRKEKDQKPKILFSIQANVWNDGVISGKFVENIQYGRERLKVVHANSTTFIKNVTAIVPETIDKITPLVKAIDGDAGTTDILENEKVGQIRLDIYSNGFIDADFFELIQGAAGRPKAWRRFFNDFANAMKNIGDAIEPLKLLSTGGVIDAKGKSEDSDE